MDVVRFLFYFNIFHYAKSTVDLGSMHISAFSIRNIVQM